MDIFHIFLVNYNKYTLENSVVKNAIFSNKRTCVPINIRDDAIFPLNSSTPYGMSPFSLSLSILKNSGKKDAQPGIASTNFCT
jgi:hypothetical protein